MPEIELIVTGASVGKRMDSVGGVSVIYDGTKASQAGIAAGMHFAANVLTMPFTPTLFSFNNDSGSDITVQCAGGAKVVVSAGTASLLYCDGSGISLVGAAATPRNSASLEAQWVAGATPTNDTFYFAFVAPYAGTVNALTYQAGSGSLDLAVKINGTNVTGLGAITVNSASPTTTDATGANTFDAGDAISGVITSGSSPADVVLSLSVTWT
jgi:hypothetical protein